MEEMSKIYYSSKFMTKFRIMVKCVSCRWSACGWFNQLFWEIARSSSVHLKGFPRTHNKDGLWRRWVGSREARGTLYRQNLGGVSVLGGRKWEENAPWGESFEISRHSSEMLILVSSVERERDFWTFFILKSFLNHSFNRHF